jgi:heat shock protein HslJ
MTMKVIAAPLIAFAVLCLCLLTACSVTNQRDPLNGSAWTLSSLNETPPLQGRKLTIEFGEGKLSGSSGCNSYSGSYEIKGNKIKTGAIGMTLMACVDPGVMEQEQNFLAYLQDAQSFTLSAGQLRIFRPDGKALAFLPQG